MTARVVDGQIKGTAEADVDGNPVTVDWGARRP